MYDDYDGDVIDIIEERERELMARKRQKALAKKKAEEASQRDLPKKRKPSKKKKRFDSDEDEFGSMSDEDEPAMAFGADSTAQRGRQKRNVAGDDISQELLEAQEGPGDDAADAAKIEAAMEKAVAAQKPRKQLPKMDVERLLSANGLNKLRDMAERFTVNEKASTAQKLNQLMSLYELWSHVMCPSMAFPDVMRRVELLGSKRQVQSFLRRLRLGENPGPWDIQVQMSEDENEPLPDVLKNPLHEADDDDDNFDQFLSQALDQIEEPAPTESRKVQDINDDEDLNDLDAFLDNLNKPVRDELL